MAASSIAKRKATKAASSPKLVSTTPSDSWEFPTFTRGSGSVLGSLLAIGQRLPRLRYDRTILHEVGEFSASDKDSVLDDLESVSYALNATISQIGLLLAGQEKEKGYVDHEQICDIGFTIEGLAHMAQELSEMRVRIGEAKPALDEAEARPPRTVA